MPEHQWDNEHALATLDTHHSIMLGCARSDLRRPGWTSLPARDDCDPMALLFGRRQTLHAVAPTAHPDAPRAGVVVLAPELRARVRDVLANLAPDTVFTPAGLCELDEAVRSTLADTLTPAEEAHIRVRYVTPISFRPYTGLLREWIEPLDETSETDPRALSLLSRYSGGVYVIRQHGVIAAYAGIRTQSPHIAEIDVRTEIKALRGHGLAQAVGSRATRAVLATGRLPVCRYPALSAASERVAMALGYQLYADALTYFSPGA